MGELLVGPFEFEFMQRALAGGLLAATVSAIVGTWVVVRGLSFLGDALAHGVIPGIALALTVGFSPVLGALGAALVMGALVVVVSSRTTIREDTGIGLLFVGMLSLGVVIVSRSANFTADLTSLLFGDILGVTAGDLRTQLLALVVVATSALVLHRPLLALSFNADKAMTLGLRPGPTHLAMLALVAVSIVASFEAVGTLMVFGLLVAPPATALLVARRVPVVMAMAAGAGWLAVYVGLLVSFHHGTAGGATISGLAVALFFVVLAVREIGATRQLSLRSRAISARG